MIGSEIYLKFLRKSHGERMLVRSPFPPSPFRRRGINRIQAVRQYAGSGLGDSACIPMTFGSYREIIILKLN